MDKVPFEVRDRIYVHNCTWKESLNGKYGTIVYISNSDYGVEFDEDVGGHNCSGHAEYGHGYWMGYTEIHLLEPDPEPPSIELDLEDLEKEILKGESELS